MSLHLGSDTSDDVILIDTLVLKKLTAKEQLENYKNCCSIKNIKYDEDMHHGRDFDGDIWTALYE